MKGPGLDLPHVADTLLAVFAPCRPFEEWGAHAVFSGHDHVSDCPVFSVTITYLAVL
jgi:hypothetical protein